MGSQQLSCLSFMITWIFVFSLLSVCSGMNGPKISLESTVFVAFTGEDLNIKCTVRKPANQTKDLMTCFDPRDQEIYRCDLPVTADEPQEFEVQLELKNLTTSGVYYCQYKRATEHWYLRVSAEGYKELLMYDYTEFIIVAIVTGVMFVFSVAGSVYVFREHWNEKITKCGVTRRKQQQNSEEREEKDTEEDDVNVMTAQSTSFYASLEPRPRSIYDVLDRSAANREPNIKKPKAKKKELQKTVEQTPKPQDEGVFESVYENF